MRIRIIIRVRSHTITRVTIFHLQHHEQEISMILNECTLSSLGLVYATLLNIDPYPQWLLKHYQVSLTYKQKGTPLYEYLLLYTEVKGPGSSSHIGHGIHYIVGKIPQKVKLQPYFNEPDKCGLLVCLVYGRLIKREYSPPCCAPVSPLVSCTVSGSVMHCGGSLYLSLPFKGKL